MALQVVIATFAGVDTAAISYSAPAGGYAVCPSNPSITAGAPSSVYVSDVTSTTANVRAGAPITGTVVVLVEDT